MNPTTQSQPAWVKQALGVLGLLIIVAGVGVMVYAAWDGWSTWRHLSAAKHDEAWKHAIAQLTIRAAMLAVVGLIAIYGGVKLLQYLAAKVSAISEAAASPGAIPAAPQSVAAVARARRKTSHKRWQSCNVLESHGGIRQLWGFSAGRNGFALNDEVTLPSDGPLPARATTRDWRALLQPKLNIAL